MRLSASLVLMLLGTAISGGCAIYRAPDLAMGAHPIHHWHSATKKPVQTALPAASGIPATTGTISTSASAAASPVLPSPQPPMTAASASPPAVAPVAVTPAVAATAVGASDIAPAAITNVPPASSGDAGAAVATTDATPRDASPSPAGAIAEPADLTSPPSLAVSPPPQPPQMAAAAASPAAETPHDPKFGTAASDVGQLPKAPPSIIADTAPAIAPAKPAGAAALDAAPIAPANGSSIEQSADALPAISGAPATLPAVAPYTPPSGAAASVSPPNMGLAGSAQAAVSVDPRLASANDGQAAQPAISGSNLAAGAPAAVTAPLTPDTSGQRSTAGAAVVADAAARQQAAAPAVGLAAAAPSIGPGAVTAVAAEAARTSVLANPVAAARWAGNPVPPQSSPVLLAALQPASPGPLNGASGGEPGIPATAGQTVPAADNGAADPRAAFPASPAPLMTKRTITALTASPWTQPLNVTPVATYQTATAMDFRAAGGAALKPLRPMGEKITDTAVLGRPEAALTGRTEPGLRPCVIGCLHSVPVSIPATESFGPDVVEADATKAPSAVASPEPEAKASAANEGSWTAAIARLWSLGLSKLGIDSSESAANAAPGEPAVIATQQGTAAPAGQPRNRKTLADGVQLAVLGPGFVAQPNAVGSVAGPQIDDGNPVRFVPERDGDQVLAQPSQVGVASDPPAKTIAVNGAEISQTSAVRLPDIGEAEVRFTGASPIAPYGTSPGGYDLRGFKVEVIPTTKERKIADCAISLSRGADGNYKVSSLLGSTQVRIGEATAQATPDPADLPAISKRHVAKPARKATVPDPTADATPAAVPMQAALDVSNGNRPYLEVRFPGGRDEGWLAPWTCRYWLEIKAPSCSLSLIRHIAEVPGTHDVLETNGLGRCQLAQAGP